MLKSRAVVLDFEDFRNTSGFIVREIAIATGNFIDIISFLPPYSYRPLSSSGQKSYQWVSKFLHGPLWKTGEHFNAICNKTWTILLFDFPWLYFTPRAKKKKYSHGTTSEKRNKFGDNVLSKK